MIILDTDHMVVLKYSEGAVFENLSVKMAESDDDQFVTTCVTLEEQLRGWLALINRATDAARQVHSYLQLNSLVDYFARWKRLDFDEAAADQFQQLRSQKIRIGTMDLRIAAIALANGATLLSANLRDFQRIPNLHVEDWLY